ncbi:hypothetical protein ACHMZP_32230 [Rhodococcus baikonurensis]|uniref:hypothetical protein n=1 Tax=Rhodococcus erythropolis group TaxID=2840174 RepID=UPI0015549BCF|nr:hypothetical protein [Rhodococcus erythropolis]PBI86884.1 hypothetical protein BKP42_63340 [Rhodococcus erythropolis]
MPTHVGKGKRTAIIRLPKLGLLAAIEWTLKLSGCALIRRAVRRQLMRPFLPTI